MLIKKFKMMKINKNYKYISAFFLLTLSLFIVGCEKEVNDESYISNDFVSFSFDQDIKVNIEESENNEKVQPQTSDTGTDKSD